MDLRTGRMYATKEEALAAGVPESDIAEVLMTEGQQSIHETLTNLPLVQFSKGPFKDRVYEKMPNGQLVRKK